MDWTLKISKYKIEKLLTPLSYKVDKLSDVKKLSLCIMSLERLYLSYFHKYFNNGIGGYQNILDTLENAVINKQIVSKDDEEQMVFWSESYMKLMDENHSSPWERDSLDVVFSESLYPLTQYIVGICRTMSPLDVGSLYQVGVNLCELYERDYLSQSIADEMTLEEFMADLHPDVKELMLRTIEIHHNYVEKKASQQEYFQSIRALRGLCSKYTEDENRYYELKAKSKPPKPEEMVLMSEEAKRVDADIKYLSMAEDLDIATLAMRFKENRKLDILCVQ